MKVKVKQGDVPISHIYLVSDQPDCKVFAVHWWSWDYPECADTSSGQLRVAAPSWLTRQANCFTVISFDLEDEDYWETYPSFGKGEGVITLVRRTDKVRPCIFEEEL